MQREKISIRIPMTREILEKIKLIEIKGLKLQDILLIGIKTIENESIKKIS